jgi:hypothetical protein
MQVVRHSHYALLYQGALLELVSSVTEGAARVQLRLAISQVETVEDTARVLELYRALVG